MTMIKQAWRLYFEPSLHQNILPLEIVCFKYSLAVILTLLYWSLGYSLERAPMVLMALRAMTAHILSQICAVVFTSPLTSRLCSQLQELQELPTSPLRMWSSSKKHQLILTLAPGPGVEPGSRGHEADALPLSYPHIHVILTWILPFLLRKVRLNSFMFTSSWKKRRKNGRWHIFFLQFLLF